MSLKDLNKEDKPFSILASLDPSFTSTGLAILNLETKTIYTRAIKVGCPDKSFDGMQKSISDIIDILKSEFDKFKVNALVHEQPFPGQMFSPALYGLDSVINHTFKDIIIHTYHPTILRKIHGFKYKKKDSKELALKAITELDDYVYINNAVENKHEKKDLFGNKLARNGDYSITSDESEALLYAFTTCIAYKIPYFIKLSDMIHSDSKGVIDWISKKEVIST